MVTTTDFVQFSEPVQAVYSKKSATSGLPTYAIETAVFELTKNEYDTLNKKFGRLYNTVIKKVDDIQVNSGSSVELPKKVTAEYSDGSAKEMGVSWDTTGLDFSKDGVYTVNGTVNQSVYNDPLVEMRADPYMFYNEEDGYYYFTGSYPVMNDADNPLVPTGPLVQLSGANMAWEYNLGTNQGIDEGPAILRHDGKIFVAYSGATVDQHYCVGMIYADEDSDLMDPSSWQKCPYPLLTTSDIYSNKNQYGPGHNSFSVDANGNTIIIYHARTWGEVIDGANNDGGLNDPGRHARVSSVHFAADGFPVLNMTEEDELASENKKVSMTVKIGNLVPEEEVIVTYTAGEGGKIEGNATQTITKGDNTQAVTAVALDGYTFSQWSDGVTTAVRNDNAVSVSKTVTAQFVKNQVTPSPVPTQAPTQAPSPVPSSTPVMDSLKINKTNITLGQKETYTLTASIFPANVSQKVTWVSKNSSIAKVSSTGKITAKKVGTVKITAKTTSGKTAICNVRVRKAPSKVTLTSSKKTLKKGKTYQLKINLPSKTASYAITYTSSDKSKVIVSASGKIKAVKNGKATITVKTFNKKKAKIVIIVK